MEPSEDCKSNTKPTPRAGPGKRAIASIQAAIVSVRGQVSCFGIKSVFDSELWILFSSSFVSATLLPGISEATLLYIFHTADQPMWALVLAATIGNTLGGFTNFVLGALAARGFRPKGFKQEELGEAFRRVQRYGPLALCFAWLPIVGDPLCLAAGYLRLNWWQSLLCMGLGKCLRYVALVGAAASL